MTKHHIIPHLCREKPKNSEQPQLNQAEHHISLLELLISVKSLPDYCLSVSPRWQILNLRLIPLTPCDILI